MEFACKVRDPMGRLYREDWIVEWEGCRALLAGMVTDVWKLVKDQHSCRWVKWLRSRRSSN